MCSKEWLSAAQARRVALAAQGFANSPRLRNRRPFDAGLDCLHVPQIDSVNVFARSHHLPMFSRHGLYDPPHSTAISGRAASSPSTGLTRPRSCPSAIARSSRGAWTNTGSVTVARDGRRRPPKPSDGCGPARRRWAAVGPRTRGGSARQSRAVVGLERDQARRRTALRLG